MELAKTAAAPAPTAERRREHRGEPRREHRGEPHGSPLGRQVWRVDCGDVVNRDRCLTVLVERNRVVLVGPPGETAVLDTGQLGRLRIALREAAEQAER